MYIFLYSLFQKAKCFLPAWSMVGHRLAFSSQLSAVSSIGGMLVSAAIEGGVVSQFIPYICRFSH